MSNSIRRVDTVARLGGDEFTLFFENISSEGDARAVGNKLKAVFSKPFQIDEQPLLVTASIGISLYPQDGIEPEILYKHADVAMYAAKQTGNSYRLYSQLEYE